MNGLSDAIEVMKLNTKNPSLKVHQKGLKSLLTYSRVVHKLSQGKDANKKKGRAA